MTLFQCNNGSVKNTTHMCYHAMMQRCDQMFASNYFPQILSFSWKKRINKWTQLWLTSNSARRPPLPLDVIICVAFMAHWFSMSYRKESCAIYQGSWNETLPSGRKVPSMVHQSTRVIGCVCVCLPRKTPSPAWKCRNWPKRCARLLPARNSHETKVTEKEG